MHNSTIQQASIIVRITLFWWMVWRQNGNTLNKLKFILALTTLSSEELNNNVLLLYVVVVPFSSNFLRLYRFVYTRSHPFWNNESKKECYYSLCCCYLTHSHKINVWTKMNVCSRLCNCTAETWNKLTMKI